MLLGYHLTRNGKKNIEKCPRGNVIIFIGPGVISVIHEMLSRAGARSTWLPPSAHSHECN